MTSENPAKFLKGQTPGKTAFEPGKTAFENSAYPPPAKFAGFVGLLGSLIGAAMPTYVVWELYSIVLENSKGTAQNTIQLADRKTFMYDATNTHIRHDDEIKQLKVDLARFDAKIHYLELRLAPQ